MASNPIEAQAGNYDRRVTIQQPDPAATADGYGEINLTDNTKWTTYATRWAKVSPLTGRELVQAKQVAARATHNVRLRSDTTTRAITTKMRILHGSVYLNIEHVGDLESARRELELVCTEAK